jgi:NADPH-dependent curcumin reductase CurA
LTQHLSVISVIIGLTAWHGVNKVLVPAPGDVVVVSAGAGAVGSLVGQLAKLKGARVVGIAGSEAKCKFMKDEVRVPQFLCMFIAAFRSLSF